MTLGDIIKDYRDRHAMNMDDFAARAGLSKAYISILERNINPVNGKSPTPSLETIKAVSAAIGLDFNQVIEALDGNQEISLSPVKENLDEGRIETVSQRLTELMKKKDLKQVDILELAKPYCDKYGVKLGRSDLSQYIAGKVEPGQHKLFILSQALGVNEAWLMGYDVPMTGDGESIRAESVAYPPLAPREQDLVKFYRGVGPSAQDYLYNKAKLLYTDAIIERDAPTIGGIAAYGGDSDAIIQTKDQQKKAEEFWRKQNQKNRKD